MRHPVYFDEHVLPGVKRDGGGRLMFELTAEEQHGIEVFFKAADGLFLHPEYAESIEKAMTAFALVQYAQDQVRLAEIDDIEQRTVKLRKALAAVGKALSFHELPIYRFDLACVFDLLGERDIASECFRDYLMLCGSFVPNVVDSSTLKQRDVQRSTQIAKSRAQINS